ncbi:MAG: ABC transporter ATP-binding protein [Gammaproteobacteria bacterium]|nr:ABC transporter ATP-binding protein [Gammaproteobacteria bacterium]
MSLLTVTDLRVYFHTRNGVIKAVDGVDFELQQGKVLGIVGESGSGKSVTCQSLLGLLPAPPARIESGSALYHSIDLLRAGEPALRAIRGRRIAMIFQDPMTSLNPYLTIGTQLFESLRIHLHLSRQTALTRVLQVMDEVGIAEPARRLDCYPHEFSGGMRQRVMIAMALLTNPEILIADEPTTALDVTIQAQILELIKKLQAAHHLAVIFITHDLGVIAGLADHILVMHQGKVVEQGSAEAVFYRPQAEYTKNLLNSVLISAKPQKFVARESNNTGRLLSVENLKTHYRLPAGFFQRSRGQIIKAVDDVTLDLQQGEILGLVGESGSGKSTTGRSIMRLTQVTSGIVRLQGVNLLTLNRGELRAIRPEIQMIFQDPYASLNPRLTVQDTLAEAIQIKGKLTSTQLQNQILQLLQDVGLEAVHLRKYPHEFSGGQRQRIAIARAIALRPKLLIADEPVSSLDVTIRAQILRLLLELNQKYSLSMLFISHDLSVIRYLTDRTAVMYQGKIVELAETEALFQSPQHPYTQALLSAIPVPDPVKERQRRYTPYNPNS